MRREITHAVEIARHYGPIAGAWIAKESSTVIALALFLTGWVGGIAALAGARF